MIVSGSSPRVRGKHARHCDRWGRVRLIPARAGKTCSDSTWSRLPGAHPRACGENCAPADTRSAGQGSSPRVRGKRVRRRRPWSAPRLIPARAGKTARRSQQMSRRGAHPRACGENKHKFTRGISGSGSSPRVRGEHPRSRRYNGRPRLIPARAGKTDFTMTLGTGSQAHPRACGENLIGLGADLAATGSSPRVRGKRHRCRVLVGGGGLIPACAGKTGGLGGTRHGRTAHPRVCGENASASRTAAATSGSSPRVRGKPRPPRERPQRPGLIPACAGKTGIPPEEQITGGAHPRVCGENRW